MGGKGRTGKRKRGMRARARQTLAAIRRMQKERERDPAVQAMRATEARVGTTPIAKLRWAVALVDRSFHGMTAGDWLNLRLELETFVRGGRVESQPHPSNLPLPSEKEGREILHRFYRILEKVVARERVFLDSFTVQGELAWLPWAGRFSLDERFAGGWVPAAVKTLSQLIVEHGHLVRVCRAPGLVAAGKDICGTWFVADRPRRIYCSPQCTSRATTKAYRAAKRNKEG